eukprot:353060-Rhodomonas_salina.4
MVTVTCGSERVCAGQGKAMGLHIPTLKEFAEENFRIAKEGFVPEDRNGALIGAIEVGLVQKDGNGSWRAEISFAKPGPDLAHAPTRRGLRAVRRASR